MFKAKKVALTSGYVQETLGSITMSCPSCTLTNDYVLCNITITGGGSDMMVTVNYGDNGPKDVFTPLSKLLKIF